jgi:hypothetical protein
MATDGSKRPAVAFVVGIGDYLHADRIPWLQFAANDAEAMAGLLVDPDVCHFPEEHVLLLTDAEARCDEIVSRLSKWLPERVHGAELVVIYFACHGMDNGPARGRRASSFPMTRTRTTS